MKTPRIPMEKTVQVWQCHDKLDIFHRNICKSDFSRGDRSKVCTIYNVNLSVTSSVLILMFLTKIKNYHFVRGEWKGSNWCEQSSEIWEFKLLISLILQFNKLFVQVIIAKYCAISAVDFYCETLESLTCSMYFLLCV